MNDIHVLTLLRAVFISTSRSDGMTGNSTVSGKWISPLSISTIATSRGWGTEKSRETESEAERHRERERETESEAGRQREERERERERERHTDRDTEI